MSDVELPCVAAAVSSCDGLPRVVIKISTPQVECNVWMPQSELGTLKSVRAVHWDAGSLRIGEAAGTPAWWSVDRQANTLTILIGQDDETWDVGITLPLETLDLILAETAGLRGRPE